MRNSLAVLHGTELHGGQDLDHAFHNCGIAPETAPSERRSAPARAAGILGALLTDAGNVDLAGIVPKSRVVAGKESVSGETMRVLFRGRPRTLEFAAPHILGSDDFELHEAPAGAVGDSDVIVTDYPVLGRVAQTRGTAISAMPWLRQRVAMGPTWSETLNRLPPGLRKKLRRLLGKQDYRARIASDMPTKLAFYERHLLPYIRRRYGDAAVVPNRRTRRREAEVSVLLELRVDDRFAGASLLRREGDTLTIGRTASAEDQQAPGEILDFLCLVLAQRLGCRWLDLGLSRPHIGDGVFCNKTKWRPGLVLPGALKSAIRIRPLRASAATLGFLSRNGFVEHRAGRFVVRRLLSSGEPGHEELGRLSEIAGRAGLDEIAVAHCGTAGSTRAALPAHVRLDPLGRGEPADLVAAFMRL